MPLKTFFILLLAILLNSCAPSPPEMNARIFLTRLLESDFDGAAVVATEETQETLGDLKAFYKTLTADERDASGALTPENLIIHKVYIDSARAIVTYSLGNQPEMELEMILVDGEWKAQIQKP